MKSAKRTSIERSGAMTPRSRISAASMISSRSIQAAAISSHRHPRPVHARGVDEHRDHRDGHRNRITVGADHGHAGKHLVQHRKLFEMLGRLEQPTPAAPQELQCLELGGQVLVGRRLVVRQVVVGPSRHVREGLHEHRGEVVGQQLDLFVHVLGGHLVHQHEVRHQHVHHLHRDVHARRPWVGLHAGLGGQRERLEALPVRQCAEVGAPAKQIVQMRGAGARQPRDHHRREKFDVVGSRGGASAGRQAAAGS